MSYSLNDLLEDPPQLHVHPGTRREVSWGLETLALRHLDTLVGPGSVTLETGAGLSTVFFALRRCHHIAIAPDAQLFERIRSHCESRNIDLTNLTLVEAQSEACLPSMVLPPLDFVLIDGDHAFPIPFIDYFYAANALKVGGYIAVDDTDILPCAILREYLREDRHWDRGVDLGKTAVFRKQRAGFDADGWERQAFLTNGWHLTRTQEPSGASIARAWRSLDAGELDAALALTERPEDSPHDEFERLQVRGRTLRRLGRLPEAEILLRKAIQLTNDTDSVQTDLAWILLESGRTGEVLELTGSAMGGSELDAEKLLIRARALRIAGRHMESRDTYRLARTIRDEELLRRELAWLYVSTGEHEQALLLVEQSADDSLTAAQSYEWLMIRARALRQLGRPGEAEDALRGAVAISKRSAPAHEELAWLAISRNRAPEAVDHARQSLRNAADSAERVAAHDVLGYALMASDRLGDALHEFDTAAVLQPDRPWTHYHKALCLVQLGRPIEAIASLERALALRHEYPEAHELRRRLRTE